MPVDRYYKDRRREKDEVRRAKKHEKVKHQEGKKKHRKQRGDDEY